MINILKNICAKGVVTETLDVSKNGIDTMGTELRSLIYRKFKRSFHIRQVDTGSCGGCESEIISCLNPFYDLQRFGIDFVASPRHADALLVTGPVSKNMELALCRTFEAVPEPKIIITLGSCAFDGGLFHDSYYTCGGVKNVLPVTFHIPGCPPSPAEIIRHLVFFLRTI